jgi:glycerol-3-phosphate acyltransferase PlsY
MITGKELGLILASYAIGCFTAGYYLVRWRAGLDLRQLGSGSVGARNAARTLGPLGFVLTFLGDCLKGWLPVRTALAWDFGPEAVIGVMLAVVAGHTWPAQLRFRGGKGVATSLGALLAYDPFVLVILGTVCLPVLALMRNFTLSGLFAFSLAPLVAFFCELGNMKVVGLSLLAVLILIAHRKNLREELGRIMHRREAKEKPEQPRPGANS